jgi:P27 family predicted phage terminase small subunit
MPRTGRPPKPVEVKRRAGNPGKRPLPEPLRVLEPLDGPPDPLKRLQRAGVGLWELIWRDGQDWLTPADVPLVQLLCEAADERERWLRAVQREGATYTNGTGRVWLHPGIGQSRALGQQMVSMLGQLGFTPADRARLGLAEVRRMAGLADLLQRRQHDLGR